MNKTKKLLPELKQLDAECEKIIKRAKLFDRAHGWSWFILVFGVLPVLLVLLSHIVFNTLLYNILEENLGSFFMGLIILIAIFFYARHKSSEEYNKLFEKQRKLYSLQVLMHGVFA